MFRYQMAQHKNIPFLSEVPFNFRQLMLALDLPTD